MGYAGKLAERERARELRARSWTLNDIATELGVSKSSVSVWVRDVEFEPKPRNRGHSSHRPHPLTVKRLAQIEQCRLEAEAFASTLTDRDLFVYGLVLYVGEGAKTESSGVRLANTSTDVMVAYVRWLRRFFSIDENRLYARLYLHVGLDEERAIEHWSGALQIARERFQKSYRAKQRGSFRRSKHRFGCVSVGYNDVHLFRRVIAMSSAISSSFADPG